MFRTRGNLLDFAGIEVMGNLSDFLKKGGNPHKPQMEKIKEMCFYLFQKNVIKVAILIILVDYMIIELKLWCHF